MIIELSDGVETLVDDSPIKDTLSDSSALEDAVTDISSVAEDIVPDTSVGSSVETLSDSAEGLAEGVRDLVTDMSAVFQDRPAPDLSMPSFDLDNLELEL